MVILFWSTLNKNVLHHSLSVNFCNVVIEKFMDIFVHETRLEMSFSNFSCLFLNLIFFFQIWILIVVVYEIWEDSRKKLEKHPVTKNCSYVSLFEWIVLVISKCCKFSAFRLKYLKFFSITKTIFSHSRSEQLW